MNDQNYQALCHNLERTLAHLEGTLELLREMSTSLHTANAQELTQALEQLSLKGTDSGSLAKQRGGLLGASNQESLLGRVPGEGRKRIAGLFAQLKVTTGRVRSMQERVWAVLSVRARVVETTLRILTGGSSPTYQSNGLQRLSGSRPILQHRC